MKISKADLIQMRKRLGQTPGKQDVEKAVAGLLATSESARGVVAGKQRPRGERIIKYGALRRLGVIT